MNGRVSQDAFPGLDLRKRPVGRSSVAQFVCKIPRNRQVVKVDESQLFVMRSCFPSSFTITDNDPERYSPLDPTASLKPTKELRNLKGYKLHHLLAAHTGHGDFAEYHKRFKHTDALLTDSCGKRKSPLYIFSGTKPNRIYPWNASNSGLSAAIGIR